MSSSPIIRIECSSSVLVKLMRWRDKARRHAAMEFWSEESSSSIPIFLVTSVIKTTCFVTSQPEALIQIGQEARFSANVDVDVENGKLFLTSQIPWQLDLNNLSLSIREATKSETCAMTRLKTSTYRLDGDLKTLAQQVWEYVQACMSVFG